MRQLARVVTRRQLHDKSGDAAHWRAQPQAERVAAVELSRQRQHGWTDASRPRLQQVHLVRALDDFGFGSAGLTAADFMQPHRVVQLSYPPLRIDLLTSVDGVAFDDCYANRVEVRLDEVVVPFIGLDDLRRNKTASGRPQALADLDALDG